MQFFHTLRGLARAYCHSRPGYEGHASIRAMVWCSIHKGIGNLSHAFSKLRVPNNGCLFICRKNQDDRTLWQASAVAQVSGSEIHHLCQEGNLDKALDVLLRMDPSGSCNLVSLFALVLKACGKRKALSQVKLVYAHMARCGLESTTFLGEHVVSTMVKCGGLEDAIEVFHKLPNPTVFSWTALISGYTLSGKAQQALTTYRLMHDAGLKPSNYTLVCLCRACGSLRNLEEGKYIYSEAMKCRCESDLFVGTCLVDMFVKCGSIPDAQNVFNGLSQKNVVSWTVLLTAYAQKGQPEKALQLLEQMHVEGVSPDDRAFVSAVQACGLLAEKEDEAIVDGRLVKVHSLQKGKAVHSHAQSKGYDSDVFVGNTLISMYGKCGSILEAQEVFDGLLHFDTVSWNVLLTAYFEQGHPEKVFLLYEQMRNEGVCPNDRTFVSLLQTCGMLSQREADVVVDGKLANVKTLSLARTKTIHSYASRQGFHSDLFVGSILASTYGKCRSILDAQNVFDGLTLRNLVLWNAMLAACVEVDQADRALHLYDQMRDEQWSPDDCTYVSMLQVCCLLADKEHEVAVAGQPMKLMTLQKGKAFHGDAWSNGYGLDSFVGSTLISMYGKCGSNSDAEVVFGHLSYHNVVACNAMLAAYALRGQAWKAFELYEQMQKWSVRPDEITLVSVLQSCSGAGSLGICRRIHGNLVLSGDEVGPFLATTLIHSYGRCASMVDAQNVFDALARPDLVSWNALIAGYAREGNILATLQCLEQIQVARIMPDEVTFLSVVSACSHAGLVEMGVQCFESMSRDYGLQPWMEHYVCLVDLLGRAGHFSRVTDLLSMMPLPPSLGLCLCLLAGCRQHGKLLLAKQAFDMAVNMQPMEPSPYIVMSSIYADAGLWECAKELKELGQQRGAFKNLPGQSWIEHEQEVQGYLVGDRKHPEVCALLQKVKECV